MPRIEWTRAKIALLGTAPDARLAGRWGVHQTAVSWYRRKLGIPAHRRRHDWASVDWTWGNARIAGKLGVSAEAVAIRRAATVAAPALNANRGHALSFADCVRRLHDLARDELRRMSPARRASAIARSGVTQTHCYSWLRGNDRALSVESIDALLVAATGGGLTRHQVSDGFRLVRA